WPARSGTPSYFACAAYSISGSDQGCSSCPAGSPITASWIRSPTWPASPVDRRGGRGTASTLLRHPRLQDLRFLLAADAGADFGLAFGGEAAEPGQQVGDGGGQGAEGQAGGDRAGIADGAVAGVWRALARHPDRQLCLVLLQKVGRHVGVADRAAGDGMAPVNHGVGGQRVVRAAGVEDAGGAV